MRLTAAFVSLSFFVLIAGCSDDGTDDVVETPPSVTAQQTFGSINRLPDGQATVVSDHVLQSITCTAGQLTMVTAAGSFVGTMDCTAQVPQETIDRFVGKPVLITVSDTRLKIEHPQAGSLDYPATGVVVTP
jgi:hypothetical protein